MATYVYPAISNLSFGGPSYSVKDAQAYHIGDVLNPGASTTTTVGTSANPFAAVYATDYYFGGVKETLVPTQGASSYAVTTTVSSASTDAQIPTAKAVYSAVASPTKTSFALGAGGSGVTLTLTAYQYSDGWVHIYGYVTMSAAIGSGGALFSVSSAYYPTEGSNFISYAPFQTSGATYPSNRIAVGFTGGGMFYNRSTTGLASGSVLYIDTYYRTV